MMEYYVMLLIVLIYIGWELEKIFRAINGLEFELSTARWERGKRWSGNDDRPDSS